MTYSLLRRGAHIVIMGGGVIGVTSAYYLHKRGFKVTILEKNQALGQETSFANGAHLGFSCVSPLRYRNGLPLASNAGRMVRNQLFLSARADLLELIAETGIAFAHQLNGVLHVVATKPELNLLLPAYEFKASLGIGYRVITGAECQQLEPALGIKPAAGILVAGDGTGDAYGFTMALSQWLQAAGVKIELGVEVEQLGPPLITNQGAIAADAYVLAAGMYSKQLAAQAGVRLLMVPKKGYSISAQLADDVGPRLGVADGKNELYYSTLGNVFRIAGITERPGYALDIPEHRIEFMLAAARELFPHLQLTRNALRLNSCLRAASHDAVPIIGPCAVEKIYLNCGHSGFGWTLAAACGKHLGRVIGGN